MESLGQRLPFGKAEDDGHLPAQGEEEEEVREESLSSFFWGTQGQEKRDGRGETNAERRNKVTQKIQQGRIYIKVQDGRDNTTRYILLINIQ